MHGCIIQQAISLYAPAHNAVVDNSGSEKLSPPAAGRARVPGPLVEAVVAVLPELDRVGLEQVTAPAGGAWDLVTRQKALELGLELVATLDRLALARGGRGRSRTRGGRGRSRPGRTRGPVRIRLLFRKTPHRALDAHLPAERPPVEDERGAWVVRQLASLPPLVAREEREAVGVGAFQQEHPCRGPAVPVGGGERHCFGRLAPRGPGLVQPLVEDRDGVVQRQALSSSSRTSSTP